MTEVLDMNINDMFGEESEFIEGLVGALGAMGVDIDANNLATILHEYEVAKMAFLKVHIMKMLQDRGGDFQDGPVKVVVSQSGLDIDGLVDDIDGLLGEADDDTDTPIFS